MVIKILWKKKGKKKQDGLAGRDCSFIALLCVTSLLLDTSLSSSLIPKGYAAAVRKKTPPFMQGMKGWKSFITSTFPPWQLLNMAGATQKGTAFIVYNFFLTSVENKAFHLLLCSWVSNLWCQHGCWEKTLKREEVGSGTHRAGRLCWCDVTHTCLYSTSKDTPSW